MDIGLMASSAIQKAATRDLPAALYHYTNQEGLLGIINSDTLWATKIQYLNDSTEYLYAIELAETLLDARLEEEADQREREKVKGMLRNLKGISQLNICVCSFSERKDVLSQWRAYASSAGFSVGFKSDNLVKQAETQGFALGRCVYNEDEQKAIVTRLIDETLATDFNTVPSYVDPARPRTWIAQPTDGGFHRNLARLAPMIKNKAFYEEREWRLISAKGINVRDLSFRAGKSMILPYFPFNLGDSKESYLHEVVVGPTPHPELSEAALRSVLICGGAAQSVGTHSSKVPYRNW